MIDKGFGSLQETYFSKKEKLKNSPKGLFEIVFVFSFWNI